MRTVARTTSLLQTSTTRNSLPVTAQGTSVTTASIAVLRLASSYQRVNTRKQRYQTAKDVDRIHPVAGVLQNSRGGEQGLLAQG
jgi:hypothetical protein